MFDIDAYSNELSLACQKDDEERMRNIINNFVDESKKMCLCDLDRAIHHTMMILRNNITSPLCTRMSTNFAFEFSNMLPGIRLFYAMYPNDIDIEIYRDHYNKLANAVECEEIMDHINVFVCEFGLCSVPDIIRLARCNQNTKLYHAIVGNLSPACERTCSICKVEPVNDKTFIEMAKGYMKESFSSMGYIPKFLEDAPEVNIEAIVKNDIKKLTETYSGDELENRINAYYEKYIDIGGFYHFMANLMQEGAYSMECYHWFFEDLESIGQRCEREERYLSLCESSYRETGKRPRYLDNTYDFNDRIHHNDDEWINPPDELKSKKDDSKDDDSLFKSKKNDIDAEDKKSDSAKRIYNITYNNSFNRNRSTSVSDSYKNNRTHSDDIMVHGGSESFDSSTSEKNIMKVWNERRQTLRKIGKTIQSKPIVDNPSDLKSSYLKSLIWDDENIKRIDPWVITLDTQKGRPKDDIGYRKHLAKQIAIKADDRDIDFDGQIVVGGDLTDGIYTIELSRYNEKYIVDALRKVSNAVIRDEIKKLSKDKSSSKNSKLNEALSIFDDLHEFEEAIKGGDMDRDSFVPDNTPDDPEKSRSVGERMRNKVEEFNAKSNKTAAGIDRSLHTGRDLKDAALRTPKLLINTVKNFISDMNDRNEQEIKEDILKDKKFRLRIYGMARSLIKTALPWVILGPLWGTLWNTIALPIRGINWGIQSIKGGPHRDLMIEMREEMRAELEIMDDKIQNAKDSTEKHKLTRQRARMEQEYFKLSSKIHFDPVADKRARRGEKY